VFDVLFVLLLTLLSVDEEVKEEFEDKVNLVSQVAADVEDFVAEYLS
jgi:hypothetical protein